MAHTYSQGRIDEFRECFSIYDKQRRGFIKADELPLVLRSLGVYPTRDEIRSYRKKYEHGERIKFDDFLKCMKEQEGVMPDTKREVLDAFRLSDAQNQGYIRAAEFKRIMTTFGESLSQREVDAVLREFGIQSNGVVRYEDFVERLLAPIPDDY